MKSITFFGKYYAFAEMGLSETRVAPPTEKPLPMNPLARPVTKWGAPGVYTRSLILDPHNVPN